MNWLRALLGLPETPADAAKTDRLLSNIMSAGYQCLAPQCNSMDFIFGRDIERVLPSGGGPRRVVIGGVYVCNRCGQPIAITHESSYHPAIVSAPRPEEPRRRVENGPAAHASWPGREP